MSRRLAPFSARLRDIEKEDFRLTNRNRRSSFRLTVFAFLREEEEHSAESPQERPEQWRAYQTPALPVKFWRFQTIGDAEYGSDENGWPLCEGWLLLRCSCCAKCLKNRSEVPDKLESEGFGKLEVVFYRKECYA